MKPALAILILGLATPAFCAAPEVDFDGKNGINKNITVFLQEAEQGIVQIPLKVTESDSRGVRTLMGQTETGEFVEVRPDRSWLDENGRRANQYLMRPDGKYYWKIHCNTNTQPTWTAKENYSHSYGSGGHFHYDPPAPALSATNVTTTLTTPPVSSYKPKPSPMLFPSMQVNTEYYYWEWMPLFSTQIVEYFEWYGACTSIQTDYLNVAQSTSLVNIPADGTGYKLVGDTPEHPDNHYVTSSFLKSLQDIGKEWNRTCPNSEVLRYNDASLVWGGVFDAGNNWTTPHSNHSKGLAIDISKIYVRKGNREKLIKQMCAKANVFSEGDSVDPNHKEPVPHFHVTSKTASLAELDLDSRIIACCPGTDGVVPAACIRLESNGVNYDEDPDVPVETNCP